MQFNLKSYTTRGLRITIYIAIAIFVLLFFLSTIIRVFVVSKSEKLIGRKLELKELHINYLKCSVSAQEFVLYEKNGQDIFASIGGLYVNFAPWHLLHREYAFSEIRIEKPSVSIIYSENGFNFDDLTTSSDSTEIQEVEEPKKTSDTIRYLVRNLSISDGYIRYEDRSISSVNELKKLGINIPEIAWDNSRSELGVDFILGENGKVSVGGFIDQTLGNYSVRLKTQGVDISPFVGYLKPYVDATALTGLVDGDITLTGEMENPMNMKVFGLASVNDFSVNDLSEKPLMAASEILVKMDSLDLGTFNFRFDTIAIARPQLTTILAPDGINLMKFFAPYFADTLATTEDSLSNDTSTVHYSINNLIVTDGAVHLSDLTLNRPFQYDLGNLQFNMNNFSDVAAKIPMSFSVILNNSGTFEGKAELDMATMDNIVFDGSISKMDMISLSPYFEYYLARPVKKGLFSYNCQLTMTPTKLNNNNKIKIDNLEFGKKTKDTTAYNVPIPLAMYVLKDRKGRIGFELPVTGNPSDPKFKLGKLIWKTAEEFFIKSATAPFNAIGKLFDVNPEGIKRIPFEYLQDSLTQIQRENLDKLAEIALAKPELSLLFIQTTHPEAEKNLIAIREAKINYLAKTDSTSDRLLLLQRAIELDDNNSGFKTYLNLTGQESDADFQNRCLQNVGEEIADQKLNQLLNIRENLLKNYFISKGLPNNSLQFQKTDFSDMPEELKKPQFVVNITLE
jgi:hypothetical protein